MYVETQYAPTHLLPPSRAAEQTQRSIYAEYVPMLTAAAALHVKAALSKAAW